VLFISGDISMFSTQPGELIITEEYKDGTTTYVCEASVGTALTVPKWRIRRVAVNGTGGTSVRWANSGLQGLVATSLAVVSGGP
jgi:hypothetical protein